MKPTWNATGKADWKADWKATWAFWQEWPRAIRYLFSAAGLLVSLLILFCLAAELAGYSMVLEWYLSAETETARLAVEKVTVGLFDIEIPADILLVRQHFEGSSWIIRPWAGGLYLGLIFFFYSILLTVSTYLSRFWYLVATGIFIGLLISMRLEQLLIFGWFDYKPLAIAILLFLPLSYYFHAFEKHISLTVRFFSFIGAFAALSLIVIFGSQTGNPFYTLAQYNFAGPVLLSIVFAILVGHEVIYFILKMITSGKAIAGQKNWVHFFTFSLIYLVNVALVYAHNAGYIEWDIIYLSEILLLAVAAVLGLWGLKAREHRYEEQVPFYPVAALFYVALAGVSFTTIGYQLMQGNDPVMEAFEDGIIFSQLGFGGMFLLYIIVNFINPLMGNLPVYRIVFKEATLPYITYRLAGIITVAAFYLLSNQVAFSQATAGFFNGLGDLYKTKNQKLLSEQYYKQGSVYGYQNHKSNYQLGFIANSSEKPGEALYYFDQASGKHPSLYSFINLSNQYHHNRQFFKGIFTLQNGMKAFPGNGFIANNLGVMYSSTNILDSAVYYFRQGLKTSFADRAAKTNIAYLAFKTGNELAQSEVEEAVSEKNVYPFLTNALGAALKTGGHALPESAMVLVPDSVLTGFTFPFVYNAALASLGQTPTILSERLPVFTEHPANSGFYSSLAIAQALQQYYSGEVNMALQKLSQVQQAFPSLRGYCYHLMAAFTLEQGAARKAAELFEQAAAEDYPAADVNQAIALSEAADLEQAALKWILLEKNPAASEVASSILPLFEVTDIGDLATDQDRYQYTRWFAGSLSDEQLQYLWSTFENENMRKAALVSYAAHLVRMERIDAAKQVLSAPELAAWDQPDLQLLLLDIALKEKGLEVLEEDRSYTMLPKTSRKVFQSVSEAVRTNDMAALEEAASQNPFRAYLMIAVADYLKGGDNEQAAYEVLVLAQQVNPYSVPVLKAYIELSLSMGLENYAEGALIRLIDLLPADEYDEYERAFDLKVEELQRARDSWEF